MVSQRALSVGHKSAQHAWTISTRNSLGKCPHQLDVVQPDTQARARAGEKQLLRRDRARPINVDGLEQPHLHSQQDAPIKSCTCAHLSTYVNINSNRYQLPRPLRLFHAPSLLALADLLHCALRACLFRTIFSAMHDYSANTRNQTATAPISVLCRVFSGGH